MSGGLVEGGSDIQSKDDRLCQPGVEDEWTGYDVGVSSESPKVGSPRLPVDWPSLSLRFLMR